MDTKYKSHSFVKLWIATTIFILCCFTTDMSAQNTAAADTVAAVTETITEVVTAPAEEASAAPDTLGELALGLNTVWMLLAAMLVFFMQPGFCISRSRFYQSEKYCQHSDEELCRLHVRLFTILVYRFRIDVRRRRIHRNAPLLRPFFH